LQEYNKLRFGDQSAGGGIGAALVEQLRDSGCIVIATDVVAPRRVAGAGRSTVHARALDVTDPAAVDALVAEVETQIGPIGFGINVAGGLQTGTVVDTDDREWRRVFAVPVISR
jgi:2,3-dihydro-2,3-dihydroxybenzoate dehydrogenase